MTSTATSRTRSQPIRVRRLSQRSTRTPATGPSSGMPRYCAIATMPDLERRGVEREDHQGGHHEDRDPVADHADRLAGPDQVELAAQRPRRRWLRACSLFLPDQEVGGLAGALVGDQRVGDADLERVGVVQERRAERERRPEQVLAQTPLEVGRRRRRSASSRTSTPDTRPRCSVIRICARATPGLALGAAPRCRRRAARGRAPGRRESRRPRIRIARSGRPHGHATSSPGVAGLVAQHRVEHVRVEGGEVEQRVVADVHQLLGQRVEGVDRRTPGCWCRPPRSRCCRTCPSAAPAARPRRCRRRAAGARPRRARAPCAARAARSRRRGRGRTTAAARSACRRSR